MSSCWAEHSNVQLQAREEMQAWMHSYNVVHSTVKGLAVCPKSAALTVSLWYSLGYAAITSLQAHRITLFTLCRKSTRPPYISLHVTGMAANLALTS